MSHLQDKICNVLTFAGLVGIIVWGTVSLMPEADATPLTADEAPEEQAEELLPDTLPELPLANEVQPEAVDTLQSDTLQLDTVASLADSMVQADTVKHPAVTVHHKAEAEPAESPATAHPADTVVH